MGNTRGEKNMQRGKTDEEGKRERWKDGVKIRKGRRHGGNQHNNRQKEAGIIGRKKMLG